MDGLGTRNVIRLSSTDGFDVAGLKSGVLHSVYYTTMYSTKDGTATL